jgi:hypothetical protein
VGRADRLDLNLALQNCGAGLAPAVTERTLELAFLGGGLPLPRITVAEVSEPELPER